MPLPVIPSKQKGQKSKNVPVQAEESVEEAFLEQEQPLPTDLLTEFDVDDFEKIFLPKYLKSVSYSTKVSLQQYSPQALWKLIRRSDGYGPKDVKDMRSAYDQFKTENGYFDVPSILNCIIQEGIINYGRGLINALFVDEVQDIDIQILQSLVALTTNFVYMSGDNAQSINKGDRNNIDEELRGTIDNNMAYRHSERGDIVCRIAPLTVNYRSHQQILNVGNNLNYLIQLFFKGKTTFLPPEASPTQGVRPVMLPLGTSLADLREFCVRDLSCGVSEDGNELKAPSGQVWIVRDEECKHELQAKVPGALVLTILQAKGMEFEDVILFNYFTDTKSRISWRFFEKCLQVRMVDEPEFKESEFFKGQIAYSVKKPEGGYTRVYIERESGDFEQLFKKYKDEGIEDAADELKFLYVGVTRAKNRLVIFDEFRGVDPSKHPRYYFDNLWKTLDLVVAPDHPEVSNQFRNFGQAVKANKTPKNWMKAGLELMKKGAFAEAEACFRSADCPRGEKLARLHKEVAFYKAEYFLTEKVSFTPTDSTETPENPPAVEMGMVQEPKARATDLLRPDIEAKIRQLGKEFIRAARPYTALQCFSIIRDVQSSIAVVKQLNEPRKLAELYLEAGEYSNAFEIYKKMEDVMGMLTALQMGKDPEQFLSMIGTIRRRANHKQKQQIDPIVMVYVKKFLLQIDAEIKTEDSEGSVQPVIAATEESMVEVTSQPNNESFTEMQSVGPSNKDNTSVHILHSEAGDDAADPNMVGDDFEDIERLSESFINISVAQGQVKALSCSAFEEIAGRDELQSEEGDNWEDLGNKAESANPAKDFRDRKFMSRLLRAFSDLWDLLSVDSSKSKTKAAAIQTLYEGENDQIVPENYLSLILDMCNAYSCFALKSLVGKQLGDPTAEISLLLTKVAGLAQISACTTTLNSVKNAANPLEKRKLATMAFQLSVRDLDEQRVRFEFSRHSSAVRTYQSQLVLLGFVRQVASLLPPLQAEILFMNFGDIEALVAYKSSVSNLPSGLSALGDLGSLMALPPFVKLSKVYNASVDPTFRSTALYGFCLKYLYHPHTYDSKVLSEAHKTEISQLQSNSLKQLFKIGSLITSGRQSEAVGFVRKKLIPDRQSLAKLIRTNKREVGVLLGFLYLSFDLGAIRSLDATLSIGATEQSGSDGLHCRKVLGLVNYWFNKYLTAPEHCVSMCKTMEGFLMALKCSKIVRTLPCMTGLAATAGHVLHKSSPLLATRSKENILVWQVDAGADFYAVQIRSFRGVISPKWRNYDKIKHKAPFDELLKEFFEHYSSTKEYLRNKARKEQTKVRKELDNASYGDAPAGLSGLKSGKSAALKKFVLFSSLIQRAWTPSSQQPLLYDFSEVFQAIKSELKSVLSRASPKMSHALRYSILLFCVCQANNKLHLYKPLEAETVKSRPDPHLRIPEVEGHAVQLGRLGVQFRNRKHRGVRVGQDRFVGRDRRVAHRRSKSRVLPAVHPGGLGAGVLAGYQGRPLGDSWQVVQQKSHHHSDPERQHRWRPNHRIQVGQELLQPTV